jgi:methionine--tRNA ligase beta chain
MNSLKYVNALLEKLEKHSKEESIPRSLIDDMALFSKVNIAIGRILSVSTDAEAHKLYYEKVDVGDVHPIDIGTGLKNHYTPEQILGMVLVVKNLKPKKLFNIVSHAMLLCAATPKRDEIEVIRPPEAPIGERVLLKGISLMPSPLADIDMSLMEQFLMRITVSSDKHILFSGTYIM